MCIIKSKNIDNAYTTIILNSPRRISSNIFIARHVTFQIIRYGDPSNKMA